MIRFFGLMLKLPVTVFVSGMGILVRSMQDVQRSFEKGVDDMVRELAGESEVSSDGGGRSPIEAKVAEVDPGSPETIQPSRVEEKMMYDDSCKPDLSGDDIKTVGYWITFQKPDYETTLQRRRDETIDYPTTAESFAGLKLADFIHKVSDPNGEGIRYPASWPPAPPDDTYITSGIDPKTKRPEKLLVIPFNDRRYLDVQVVLDFRRERQDPKYAKQQVDVLRQIRDKLK